jgi:hypothetical protein
MIDVRPPDAFEITRALGGHWRGRHGLARCPAHDDRTPSLSITASTAGFTLVHCFSGCTQAAVIAALRARGLWTRDAGDGPVYAPQSLRSAPDGDAIERRRRAEEIWIKARPASGTMAETYLRSRGIAARLPEALRFMPSLPHAPSRTSWPALIAAVTTLDGALLAVQRTWLARDGRGKAPVEPAKMTLGPMDDGAVRLATPHGDTLGLAEGVETAMSARKLYSLPVWAVLGCRRFTAVRLPPTIETVILFADRGDAGWKAATKAADRWEAEGRHAEIVLPENPQHKDFNDTLQAPAGVPGVAR